MLNSDLERLERGEFTPAEDIVIKELVNDVLKYLAALKVVATKIEILREDYKRGETYNPIEHIVTRIKKPKSVLRKMYVRGLPLDCKLIEEELNDIAGARIVCTFESNIYEIAALLAKDEDIHILEVKDYIKNPKPSGYKSYHMIVSVPVFLKGGKSFVKVEIQIRTMGMDFWASLEHKIKYKYVWEVPEDIRKELLDCSAVVSEMDAHMCELHKKVHNLQCEDDD